MNIEIKNNQEFEQLVLNYGFRHLNGQPFTVDDLFQHLPSANKTRLRFSLEDLVFKGTLKKYGDTRFFVPDNRDLKTKVMDCYGNKYQAFTIEQLGQMIKRERTDHIKEAVEELVKDGLLERCPFLGSTFWLKLDN